MDATSVLFQTTIGKNIQAVGDFKKKALGFYHAKHSSDVPCNWHLSCIKLSLEGSNCSLKGCDWHGQMYVRCLLLVDDDCHRSGPSLSKSENESEKTRRFGCVFWIRRATRASHGGGSPRCQVCRRAARQKIPLFWVHRTNGGSPPLRALVLLHLLCALATLEYSTKLTKKASNSSTALSLV